MRKTTRDDLGALYKAASLRALGVSRRVFRRDPKAALMAAGQGDAQEIMETGYRPLSAVQARLRTAWEAQWCEGRRGEVLTAAEVGTRSQTLRYRAGSGSASRGSKSPAADEINDRGTSANAAPDKKRSDATRTAQVSAAGPSATSSPGCDLSRVRLVAHQGHAHSLATTLTKLVVALVAFLMSAFVHSLEGPGVLSPMATACMIVSAAAVWAMLLSAAARRRPGPDEALRAAGEAGERRALDHLARLPAGFVVLNQVHIPSHHAGGGTREADYIVVGKGRAVLLEVKSQRGRITGSANARTWQVSKTDRFGRTHTKPMRGAVCQAVSASARLRHYLKRHDITLRVDALVYMAHPASEVNLEGDAQCPVVQGDLCAHIMGMKARRRGASVKRIVAALEALRAVEPSIRSPHRSPAKDFDPLAQSPMPAGARFTCMDEIAPDFGGSDPVPSLGAIASFEDIGGYGSCSHVGMDSWHAGPSVNIDGSPMIGDVDIHGHPFGVTDSDGLS